MFRFGVFAIAFFMVGALWAESFKITHSHTMQSFVAGPAYQGEPLPVPDISPQPLRDVTPNVQPQPSPDGRCQCGCGKRRCRCGQALGAVGCSVGDALEESVEFDWSEEHVMQAYKIAAAEKPRTLTAYAPIWCPTCPGWKANLPGDAEYAVNWVISEAPSSLPATTSYPAFYYMGSRVVDSPNPKGDLTYAQAWDRIKQHADAIHKASGLPSRGAGVGWGWLDWGKMSGKGKVDAALDTVASLFGDAGVATLPPFKQTAFDLGKAKLKLPAQTALRWDFKTGTKRVLLSKPYPRFTLFSFVDVEMSGVVYDGTRITFELVDAPDPSLEVTP